MVIGGTTTIDSGFKLTLIDSCFKPDARVIPRTLSNPETYYYGETILEYDISESETDPPNCSLDYDCFIIAGPRLDLCDKVVGTNLYSKFENTKLIFKASDEQETPQGDYIFVITAMIRGGSA